MVIWIKWDFFKPKEKLGDETFKIGNDVIKHINP